MPKFKPRRMLRKGKRQKGAESKERKWLLRCLVQKTGGLCEYCHKPCNKDPTSPRRMTIDHIVPVSQGGLTEITNLRLACYACNQEKGDGVSLDVFLIAEP